MSMHLRIVCPETCVYEGPAAYVAVPSTAGEFGILPHHASEICTVDRGIIRVSTERMGVTDLMFAVYSGYVQVAHDEVIVLVERAADLARVDADEVVDRIAGFEEELGNMSETDARRSYLYNEIAWCKLLLHK